MLLIIDMDVGINMIRIQVLQLKLVIKLLQVVFIKNENK
jgi:hypothetical protein